MFSHTKPLSAVRIPLTFAALSILLAACGGGNDDGTPAVSASPRASTAGSTSTSGATSSSTASSAAGASTTIAANGSGTSSGNTANPAATGANQGNGNASPAGQQDANASGNAPASSANGSSASTANPASSNAGDATPVGNGTGNSAANSSPAAPAGGSTSPVAPAPRADGATPDLPAGVNATPAGTPADNNTPPAATVPIPTGPVAAISAQGVRGDVLLAMMEQVPCNRPYIDPTETLLGKKRPDTDGFPDVSFTARIDAHSPYSHDLSAWNGSVPPNAGDAIVHCTHAGTRSYTAPIQPGSYRFEMSSARSVYTTPNFARSNVKQVNATVAIYPLNVTAEQVEIGGSVELQLAEGRFSAPNDDSFQRVETQLNAEAYTFRRDALVPFGTLRAWQDEAGNHVRLMLIQGDTADQAKVCTEFNSALAKRLQCKTWHVPADWQWGQELTRPNVYVIDDRSVYPNESGQSFWGNVGHYHQRAGQD